ncbi:type II toxin-antitoxin system RelE/ParE family toxin [Oscillatoria sp. FACHB-1406]|uniref:type II toxin-antitoxin system RelE/ParE family toxin n=1 Tax=Oscillatoria sp. FACHB-1406 TaxID=2692846 RepID=UPI001685A50C|nr:type II toxin-antitoxin system RelE/ParE family toxin [Oscillatoria sp. FACHB-1406]MBD2578202.1 type II toxin-antitoxin system RelE/ParE family toxin [Oscillatoria sp. FACHB-1406]
MSSYSFSDDAIQDLDEICEYIARNNPKAASKLFEKIRERCKVVADFPNMGKSYSKLSPGLRGFIVDERIVFYYAREDGIDVARVVSGYRDLESLFSELNEE